MFGKGPDTSFNEAETIIGPSVKVEGDFLGQGNVIVEGVVVGQLKTDQNLKIGEHAQVQAEVRAQNAFVAGSVRGNIEVTGQLELASTAKVMGDISAEVLSVEPGASINGRVSMAVERQADSEAE